MTEYFTLFKALHIIAVISWMAGMFYLPRLFAYHTEVAVGSDSDKLFQRMERRLLRIIINPSMVATIIFGAGLARYFGMANLGTWFHLKMLLVVLMTVLHGLFARWRKDFELGQNKHSAKFYKIFNEFPPILMIFIILLVIFKPFED
jgi:putative membrane protein